MGNGGFIEPPPGLFGGAAQRGDERRDAHAGQDRLPANPFAPPGTPAERQVPPPSRFSVVADPTLPAGSWVVRPADRPAPPLPDFPRLTPPPPPAPAAPAHEPSPVHPPAAGPAPESPDARHGSSEPLPDWSLVLGDGVAIPLYGPVIVGRNPSGDRFPGATLAAVPDPTRTMSKTHARFYLDSGVPMVDDLGSTNGIALFPGGNTQGAMAVEPGAPVEVRSGDVVQLGEYEITVRRN